MRTLPGLLLARLIVVSVFRSAHLYAEETCHPISADSAAQVPQQVAELEWKRAIDQDKAKELKRLLSVVDVKITNDKGKTALMAAVKIGDQCLLQELLQRGLSMADVGYTGGTALMYAVLGNHAAMIDQVLIRNPDLNAQSTNGWTAVMIAAAKGFDGAISVLHEAGADVNLADVYEWTPLMRALDNRHGSVVDYLLSVPDTELNHVNENGSAALHIAAQVGDKAAIQRLLQRGVARDLKDKNGRTPVDVAILNNHFSIAELIRSSAD